MQKWVHISRVSPFHKVTVKQQLNSNQNALTHLWLWCVQCMERSEEHHQSSLFQIFSYQI